MDKIITLNGEQFLICGEADIDTVHYIFAVALESNKYTVLKRKETENGNTVVSVTDKQVIDAVLKRIAKDNI